VGEVTKVEPQEAAPAEFGSSLLEVISKAARDPSVDIDKMERLLAMQERLQAQAAKQAFTDAKIAMRPHLPEITMKGMIVIKKDGKIIQETPFARFEDLHELVMPVLSEHGFDLKFKNGLSPDGKVRVTTILCHREGHEDDTYFDLPHDSSGSKNPVQAVGSSTKYGMRYGTISILNLRVVGDDDDGVSSGPETVVTKSADAPFPQGPAKNKTELKAMGRDLWRDIEAISDSGSLDDVLTKGAPLLEQLRKALPDWCSGGRAQSGETYEGLDHVIERVRRDITMAEQAAGYLRAG
jgi:hypothetical protein